MSLAGAIGVFGFSAGGLYLAYVYAGYGFLLWALATARGPASAPPAQATPEVTPTVTVMLTVHNEAETVEARIENLLGQDYPPDRLDILVVSDGSTDATDQHVDGLANTGRVRLVRTERLGKSGAQNQAMSAATGEIVVFTDAAARFAPDFVRAIVRPFDDPRVGCATAHLQFVNRPGAIAQSQGFYWTYELWLRQLESRLGLLAVASGQAMAVRRAMFRLIPTFVGEDCVIPLDIVRQGGLVKHCADALAFDSAPSEEQAELKARIRMTLRNWTGSWLFPELLNPVRHPGYAFALWSHKLMRWLGPAALALMAVSAGVLWLSGSTPWAALGGVAFFGLGALGALGARLGVNLPLAGTVYSFLLANAAFAVGLGRAMLGRRIVAYPSGR